MARTVGFFTDTTLCIGCKACEVACKEWNQLPGHAPKFGDGYDNTGQLDEQNWRHVQFHERITPKGGVAWNMMSDVCKHCALASCMEVCPTNAIIRTEFDTVYIQPNVCNGCRDCIAACPYHVIGFDETSGLARKCTFCYDRLQANLTPACAKACPTESIKFGDLNTMREVAGARLNQLRGTGDGGGTPLRRQGIRRPARAVLADRQARSLRDAEDRGRRVAEPQQRRELPGLTGHGRAGYRRRGVRVPTAGREGVAR